MFIEHKWRCSIPEYIYPFCFLLILKKKLSCSIPHPSGMVFLSLDHNRIKFSLRCNTITVRPEKVKIPSLQFKLSQYFTSTTFSNVKVLTEQPMSRTWSAQYSKKNSVLFLIFLNDNFLSQGPESDVVNQHLKLKHLNSPSSTCML